MVGLRKCKQMYAVTMAQATSLSARVKDDESFSWALGDMKTFDKACKELMTQVESNQMHRRVITDDPRNLRASFASEAQFIAYMQDFKKTVEPHIYELNGRIRVLMEMQRAKVLEMEREKARANALQPSSRSC